MPESRLLRFEGLGEPSDAIYGKPIARLPISWRVLTGLTFAMFAAGIFLLSTTGYERKEQARGILRSQLGETLVVASERGIVHTINVREGQIVQAGQPLLAVNTERTERNGRAAPSEMLESLAMQEASVRRRLSAINSNDELDIGARYARNIALEAALSTTKASLRAAQEQDAIARENYEIALPVAKRGFISRIDITQRKQAMIQSRQTVADAYAAVHRLTAELAEHRAIIAKRPFSIIQERGQLEDTLADIAQRRVQYETTRGYRLSAPMTGRVSNLQADLGQVVGPERPLMSIVPLSSKLVAILYVPSRGVGFLQPGQSVRIRYEAFPFQRFGAARAHVKYVSQTVLRPEEISSAIRLDEPSYRIVAELDQQSMKAFGEQHALYPGMALEADIVLERRTFAEWLFEPLLALKGRL